MLYSLTVKYIFLYISLPFAISFVELTNVKYESLNKDYLDFEYCYIKSVNRSYKYVSVKVNLFKIPLESLEVTIQVKKRANGYKPFLFNFTFDFCKFIKQRKSNPLNSYFYGFIKGKTNLNHSCPYNHDLLFEKIDIAFIDHHVTNVLPVPEGDYVAHSSWWAYNKARVNVYVFVTIRH